MPQMSYYQMELPFESMGEALPVSRSEETSKAIRGTECPGQSGLLLEVVGRRNLHNALKRVKQNKGSAGIDGMTVDELSDYLRSDWPRLRVSILERNHLRVRVPDSALQRDGGLDASLAVRFGKELVNGLPSFYLAMGDVELPDEAIATCVRLYWNTDPAAAIQLTRALTTHLNREQIPFRFKVINDPTLFNRNDAAVLYLRPEDYESAFAALEDELPALLSTLRPGVPALTRQLAPGLAVAEDPGEDGDSFGLHRCRRLAEGLLKAAEKGVQDFEERVRHIVKNLESAGLDPERPYLRPGSMDRYGIELPSLAPRKVTSHHRRPTNRSETRRPDEVAALLGSRLVSDAVWHGERCTWLGCEDHLNSVRTAPVYLLATLAPDLYTGTAGIALFLANLFHHTGDLTFRRTALGALRQAFYEEQKLSAEAAPGREPVLYPGFFSGAAGVALAARRVAEICTADELATGPQSLLLKTLEPSLDGWESDLLTGVAGALLGLSGLRHSTDNEGIKIRAAGERCVQFLADQARWEGEAASWASPAFPRPYHLTGYLHGAAGIAHALLEWYVFDRSPETLRLAEAAFAYEDNWFDCERGWADLRSLRKGEAPRAWLALWCHGAAGIALARARAFEITGHSHHRLMAQFAIEAVSREVHASLEEGRGNFSLAEGLTGSIESILLASNRIDPRRNRELEELAMAVAEEGVARYLNRELPWAGGVASGEAPGLFLGLAGTGHFYLRCSAPEVPSPLFFAAPPTEPESRKGIPPTVSRRDPVHGAISAKEAACGFP